MLKGYRTVIFNIIMALVMVYRMWFPDMETPTEEAIGQMLDSIDVALVAIWGVGNVIFRMITSTPIFKKDPEE